MSSRWPWVSALVLVCAVGWQADAAPESTMNDGNGTGSGNGNGNGNGTGTGSGNDTGTGTGTGTDNGTDNGTGNGNGNGNGTGNTPRLPSALRSALPAAAPPPPLPKVHGAISAGMALDGAERSGLAAVDAGHTVDLPAARAILIGSAIVGSRGLGLASLTTFLSMNMQLGNQSDNLPIASTVGNRTFLQVRSAWGELQNPIGFRKTAPMRARAGRHYANSVWPVLLDGLTLGWDQAGVSVAAFTGAAVASFADPGDFVTTSDRPVSGLSAAIGLANTRLALPVTLTLDTLQFDTHRHHQGGLAYQPRRDRFVRLAMRTLDGRIAQQSLQARASFAKQSHVSLELVRRHGTDWRWDPALVATSSDPLAARRYLELGAAAPQWAGSIRGGLVLLSNIDVFAKLGMVRDRVRNTNPLRPAWYEGMGGAEVRVRRAFSVAGTAMYRHVTRLTATPIMDQPGVAQALPVASATAPAASWGERNVFELSGLLKLTLGAKRLSASGEIYWRRTTFATTYQAATSTPLIPDRDTSRGARVSLDAWLSSTRRFIFVYDGATRTTRYPEITGHSTMRMLFEATL